MTRLKGNLTRGGGGMVTLHADTMAPQVRPAVGGFYPFGLSVIFPRGCFSPSFGERVGPGFRSRRAHPVGQRRRQGWGT